MCSVSLIIRHLVDFNLGISQHNNFFLHIDCETGALLQILVVYIYELYISGIFSKYFTPSKGIVKGTFKDMILNTVDVFPYYSPIFAPLHWDLFKIYN